MPEGEERGAGDGEKQTNKNNGSILLSVSIINVMRLEARGTDSPRLVDRVVGIEIRST